MSGISLQTNNAAPRPTVAAADQTPNAQALIQKHTKSGDVDTERLAQDVLAQAKQNPAAMDETMSAVITQLPANQRDDFGRDILAMADDATLVQMAKTGDGALALIAARDAVRSHGGFFDSSFQATRAEAAILTAVPELARSNAGLAMGISNTVAPHFSSGTAQDLASAVAQQASTAGLQQVATSPFGRAQLLAQADRLAGGNGTERQQAARLFEASSQGIDAAKANELGVAEQGLSRVDAAQQRVAKIAAGLPTPPDANASAEASAQWASTVHAQFTVPNRTAFVDNQMTRCAELRGDSARSLTGSALSNEIGVALNLMPNREPKTPQEQTQFEQGQFTFYKGKELEAISAIRSQIEGIGGATAKVTTLPIVYDSPQTGLPVTLPLFRVTDARGNERFVDHTGRKYDSFQDWKENNQLPPGTMSFPKDGHLTMDAAGKVRFESGNTPDTKDTFWENYGKPVLTGVAIGLGVVGGAILIVGTGGIAALGIAGLSATTVAVGGTAVAASTVYFAAESAGTLKDRADHGQSLSLSDPQARAAWIGLGASALTFASMGTAAIARSATPMAAAVGQGSNAANAARYTGVAAQWADTAAMANTGVDLVNNWSGLSTGEKVLAAAQFGFWGAGTAATVRQAGGLRNLYGLHDVQYAVKIHQSTHASTDPAVMATRKAEVESYMLSVGVPAAKVNDFMNGIDLRFPVKVITLNPGDRVYQLQHRPGDQGSWYSLTPQSADRVGVADSSTLAQGTHTNSLEPKTVAVFQVTGTKPIQVLQSTSKPVADSWSIQEPGTGQKVPVKTLGGADQLYINMYNPALKSAITPATP
jgi:LAS superfamily LD-carboxypeptidase LdcB